MGYFSPLNLQCRQHPDEWNQVLNQIKGWKFSNSISGQISQSLEAKALYVFTMAQRLMRAAHWLCERKNGEGLVFLEATVLLFPMIELLGYARLDNMGVSKHHPKEDVSNVNRQYVKLCVKERATGLLGRYRDFAKVQAAGHGKEH
jgi:hypothetical protein